MRLSTQYKLTLAFTGLMAALLLSINLMMYNLSSGYRKQNFFRSMEDRANITAISHRNKDFQVVLDEIKRHHIHRVYEADDTVFEIDQDQAPDAINIPEYLPLDAEFFQEVIEEGSVWTLIDERSYVGVLFEGENDEKEIIVVTSAVDIKGNNYRKKLRASLAVAFLIALTTMGIASVIFSRKLFDPVVRMIRKVNNINAFNLNTRLEGENSSGEITELKNTVNDMLERIEAAFRAQQRFIGNTTHSLRTPLTVIAGEAEIAMSKINPDHKAYYSLEMIIQETEKLKHIISTLLELAKTGTEKEKNDWKIIRIDELVQSVYHAIYKMDHRYKLKVDFSNLPKDSALLHIHGNEYLMSLAISNVVLNSFKYSNNNKVKIKASVDRNNIIIKIIDKGIGIPENEVKQIFIPYFRASNTEGYEGFGIGLPLAMDIVRVHSGNIQVSSKLGVGTKVSIILPLAEPYE